MFLLGSEVSTNLSRMSLNQSDTQDYLMQIVAAGYGFDVPEIQNALLQTNYQSIEAAVEYLVEHPSYATQLLNTIFKPSQPQTPLPIFKETYTVNSAILESGNKIVMPPSALQKLSAMSIQFPICFQIKHYSDTLSKLKVSHCGVLEFTAPENTVYLPLWMMDNLGIQRSSHPTIQLTTKTLPKGRFIQFQPHQTSFTQLSNPRVVLENRLRDYTCLTVGDTIHVEFCNYIYKLDVTQVQPSIKHPESPPGIDIIETDLKVDFKQPLDYQDAMTVNMEQQFTWRITLTEIEKELLMSGYIRKNVCVYITNEIIKLMIKYVDHCAVLDDIIHSKPYSRYNSNIFDVYGVKLQLSIIPNGERNDRDDIPENLNLLQSQNVTEILGDHCCGDNSCVLLSANKMQQLGVVAGDAVVVKGSGETVLIALSHPDMDSDKIVMNTVVCDNVGCKYGENVLVDVLSARKCIYGKSIRLSPLNESKILEMFAQNTFEAISFTFSRNYNADMVEQCTATEIWNRLLRPYFHDAYRIIRIGDVYRIGMGQYEMLFQITDIQYPIINQPFEDNSCIVGPQTLVFVDEPMKRAINRHISRPLIELSLKELPLNIKEANIEFSIKVPELKKVYKSSYVFCNDNVKYIQKQSKWIYSNKLKDCNQLSLDLKIKSMKLKQ